MSSEVFITESTAPANLKSAGSTKFYKKRDDASSFNNFIDDLKREPESKVNSKSQDSSSKDSEPIKPRPRQSEEQNQGGALEKNNSSTTQTHQDVSSGHNVESSRIVTEDTSSKGHKEMELEEVVEVSQFVSVPIVINVGVVPDALSNVTTLESGLQKEVEPIVTFVSSRKQEQAVNLDNVIIESVPLTLEPKEINEEGLKNSTANLSIFQNKQQLTLTEPKNVTYQVEKDFDSDFIPINTEKNQDLLLKSLESQSKEPTVLIQAKVGVTENHKTLVLSSNIEPLEIADDAIPGNANSKQPTTEDHFTKSSLLAPKEVVQIAPGKVKNGEKSAGNEFLLDDKQTLLGKEEISNFALIDNSKTKLDISFDDTSMINSDKTTPKPQEQLSMSVRYAVSQGKSEVTINLYPKSLGAIDVKVEFSTNPSGQTEVQKVIIIAERNSTLNLLESTKHHLETALAEMKKELTTTVTDTSKKEASLQFDMRGGNNGESNEAYFDSFEERENWMNKFRNLTTSENSSTAKSEEALGVSTRRNVYNSTSVDIEV